MSTSLAPRSGPPEEASRAAEQGLRALISRGSHRSSGLNGAEASELQLTHPHEVFLLGLDGVREGSTLDTAQSAGWRYVVERDGQAAGLADVGRDTDGNFQLNHVQYGPYVAGTQAAWAVLTERSGSSGEVRLLQLPAIHLMALWTVPPKGDIQLVPIAPAPPEFEPGHLYTEPTFIELMRRRVELTPSIPPESEIGD